LITAIVFERLKESVRKGNCPVRRNKATAKAQRALRKTLRGSIYSGDITND
jgi:hypothetical protein